MKVHPSSLTLVNWMHLVYRTAHLPWFRQATANNDILRHLPDALAVYGLRHRAPVGLHVGEMF